MEDHPLNRNKRLLPHYRRNAILIRAVSRRTDCRGDTIEFFAYRVSAYTACGAWISTGRQDSKDKFVNLRATKQYASASMAEAAEQLKRRKIAQIRIMEARIDAAHVALDILQRGTYYEMGE